MVLDTSALLAMLFAEPERDAFLDRLANARDPIISAATLLEASIVMYARTGTSGVEDLDRLLNAAGVRCVAVDREQAVAARDGYARFGKGQAPAGLNFGDCFAYALAKSLGRPLPFKGDDFDRTDLATVE
ncbi:MAG TPA: type II toxin-antitoxin system VapC family toxin [Solirubrobacter sp.]|jgi:ribonuclease VapC|nr:type II toxin-antitoxin system VapC family toxin [Solirubrobacter sp.]